MEHYFRLTCADLQLDAGFGSMPALDTAALIRAAYERAEVSALEAVHMMADLHRSQDSEQLLTPWSSMRDELDWPGGCFYPPSALASLDAAVRREWALLARAIALRPPQGWLRFARCIGCGHVGELVLKRQSLVAKFIAALTQKPVGLLPTCAVCGSSRYSGLGDPDVRSAYMDDLEKNARRTRGDDAGEVHVAGGESAAPPGARS